MSTLETSESGYVSEDEEPEDTADYDFRYSGGELFSADGYHQSAPETHHRSSSPANSNTSSWVRTTGVKMIDSGTTLVLKGDSVSTSSNMSTIPPPMM